MQWMDNLIPQLIDEPVELEKKKKKKKVEVQDLRENNHSLYMNISNIPWISKEIPKDHNL